MHKKHIGWPQKGLADVPFCGKIEWMRNNPNTQDQHKISEGGSYSPVPQAVRWSQIPVDYTILTSFFQLAGGVDTTLVSVCHYLERHSRVGD